MLRELNTFDLSSQEADVVFLKSLHKIVNLAQIVQANFKNNYKF